MKYIIFSTKRSTHHAFIEGLLDGRKYFYENNLKRVRRIVDNQATKLALLPAVSVGEPRFAECLYFASFEAGYSLPDLLESPEFKEKFPEDTGEFRNYIYIRDPLNTLASMLSVHHKKKEQDEASSLNRLYRNFDVWISLYRFSRTAEQSGITTIYANKVWRSPEYREYVSGCFDLDFVVSSRISRFARGGNSFFEGKKVDSDSLEKRFHKMIEDKIFIEISLKHQTIISEFLTEYNELDKLHTMDRCWKNQK